MAAKEQSTATLRKDMMRQALAHYEELATKACWHRSDIPEAIRAYYSEPVEDTEHSWTAEEYMKGCEHDGSFIPVNEVIRLMNGFAASQRQPQPTAEGAEEIAQRCPVCGGNGLVPNGFYRQTSGDWSTTSITPETCRTCNGTGFIIVSYLHAQRLADKMVEERMNEAIKIVNDLAEWSKKYPVGCVHSENEKIEEQLQSIEERAKVFRSRMKGESK